MTPATEEVVNGVSVGRTAKNPAILERTTVGGCCRSDLSLRRDGTEDSEQRPRDDGQNSRARQAGTRRSRAGEVQHPQGDREFRCLAQFCVPPFVTRFKVIVPAKLRLSGVVASFSKKYCTVNGTNLKGLKAGTCRLTLVVTPLRGKSTRKAVVLSVT